IASWYTSSLLWSLIIATALWLLIRRRNLTDKDGHPIPPGPPIRYLFLRRYPEKPLYEWAKQYGPIYSVWMGTQLFVVINDPQAARDLLVIHGANFSSRWAYFMKNQTILRGGGITAASYNDTWRKHRKIAMWLLNSKAIRTYAETIDYEAHMFLRSLYETSKGGQVPIDPAHYAGRYALNNMLTLTFGSRTVTASDPLVQEAIRLGMEFMRLTGPWTNMIDFFKVLQWIPTTMRAKGRKLHNDFIAVYGAMMLRTKARMDAGEEVPDCLVKTLIQCKEEEQLSWEDMCFIVSAFTTGGVHSTSGIVEWFLALMPSHPHVQAKAAEELGRVVGRHSWPTADDEMRLPYCRAILKEVLRVHSPFWMGTPHCSDEDFVYNGYFIPGNTVMVLNVYALHHNEARYPDSWTFNPDRYLGDHLSAMESAKQPDTLTRDHWAFGAGRRICPGMEMAERELFLVVARLLWAFTFHEVPGEPICLQEYEGLSGRTPFPYRLILKPRHEMVHDTLVEKNEIALDVV
ncbi:3-hydroxyphenylacetate 6-hydroxylase, partial [Leucoagaricus sp. SymC.cos]